MTPHTILIGGGPRSGKTGFALERAEDISTRSRGRRVYVATGEALDGEMSDRITRHRAERGKRFETIEEPLNIVPRLAALMPEDVAVVDCIGMWISNLLGAERDTAVELHALGALMATPPCSLILVTSEVGLGLLPMNALARQYVDIIGRAHRVLAASVDEVHLSALGLLIQLKPTPITTSSPADFHAAQHEAPQT